MGRKLALNTSRTVTWAVVLDWIKGERELSTDTFISLRAPSMDAVDWLPNLGCTVQNGHCPHQTWQVTLVWQLVPVSLALARPRKY